MKRTTRVRLNSVKTAALLVLVAIFAFIALPFGGLFGSRRAANAEVETAETNNVGGSVKASADTVSVDLTVYYYSKTGNYDGYNMWVWNTTTGGDGAKYAHDFAEGTVEMDGYPGKEWKRFDETILNVDTSMEKAIGVIVRKKVGTNDWGEQTPDMMIPGNRIVGNAVTVYIVQGTSSLYYTAEDAMSNKITQAFFNDLDRVRVVTSAPVTNKSIFKVRDEENNIVGTLDCTAADGSDVVGETSFNITLDTGYEIDFAKKYTVYDDPAGEFDTDANFVEQSISFTKLFDMPAFENEYKYEGTLGADYSHERTVFTVWSPAATAMRVNLYDNGEDGTGTSHNMVKGEKGVWSCTVEGDLDGKYYTYSVGSSTQEIVDPYARSAGRNGKRGMILDLDSTDPDGWENHIRPAARGSYSNAIIYEAHVRDLTIHQSSNVTAVNRGKFLGMTEKGTDGAKTPLDYIKELGVTELHILPMFDYNSVNESFTTATYNQAGQYNWGYDPLNYNVPEGSYSSDPADGAKRVNELKQMIMALHEAGIRVIMDVVYNHVADANGSNFQALMPNYYFRTNDDGSFTNGSGCGNDTASERYMYHRFMVDSVNYWADEYKIDGFRFDLMGLHDTITMNEIYDTLAEKNPDIMIYGEGWEMGTMVETEDMKKADMFHAEYMPNIAFFNDTTRDALKGGGFGQKITAKGFIEGAKKDAAVYVGAAGALKGTLVKDVGYSTLGKSPFTKEPTQNINYVSCHDNSSLWDKINASVDVDLDTRKAMNRVAAAAVLTSQGPSFFLAGEEMLRTKAVDKTAHGLVYDATNKAWSDPTYDSRPEVWMSDPDYVFADNSYKSPDSVNAIDWTLAETNADMVEFYKQLIALRKNSPQFRISTKAQIEACLTIADGKKTNGIVSYAVKDPASDEYAVVLFNVTEEAAEVKIPQGSYSVYVNGNQANGTTALSTFSGDTFTVGSFSAVVMKGELTAEKVAAWKEEVEKTEPAQPIDPSTPSTPGATTSDDDSNLGLALGLGIGIPAAALIAGGVVFGVMMSKKKGKSGNKGKEDSPADDASNGDGPDPEPEKSEDGGAVDEEPTVTGE